MASELFDNILQILAVCVLVDHRERDRELVEFVHCAGLHNRQLHPDVIMCDHDLRAWFSDHKDALKARLESPDAQAFKEDILSRIQDRGVQRSVLASIFAISICDYDLDDEENAYIKTALRVWKSKLPDPTEIGEMC